VRPEDALRARDDVSMSSPTSDKEEELATEIYVPLVHYAHNKFVPKSQDQNDEDDKRSVEVMTHSPGGSRNESTINLSTMLPHGSSANLIPSCVLDISVQVSRGRWEVDGQTVKWWYPVPKEGEPNEEYTIEIRRNGGVIKSAADHKACGGWFEALCPNEGCCIM